MDYHGWSSLSGAHLPQGAAPRLVDLCSAVARNIDGARRRNAGNWAAPGAAHVDQAKLPDGATVGAQLSDDIVPQKPPRPVSLRPRY